MGDYLSPGSREFQKALRGRIYVDKTGLIAQMNALIDTPQQYVCISRPRRFGKSMAMNMLAAYYDCGMDSRPLFHGLAIAGDPTFLQYINRYHVVQINMQEFLSQAQDTEGMLTLLQLLLRQDMEEAFPDTHFRSRDSLVQIMKDVYSDSGRPFVILIDEWDCLFREFPQDVAAQRRYLDFLRLWLKDQRYVALACMTGILPIKKYGTHSALNMFTEYSMTNTGSLARYYGFTEKEVKELCGRFDMSFEEAKAWYDGYTMTDTACSRTASAKESISIYSPKSIVEAMLRRCYDTYWNQTETYEALKLYIGMNYDGLKDAVIRMLAGESIPVETGSFTNDMTTFAGRDDVLTLLVHLGYLSYDWTEGTVHIPNREVSQEYVTAIRTMDWPEVTRSVAASKELLEALWRMDEQAVADGIAQAHQEISILTYNDENSLSCTITLAFYCAREFYTIVRKLPAGKGYADIALIPRTRYADRPAVLIELKRDRSASGAIAQIHDRQYAGALRDHADNLLLCGINYDTVTKTHTCRIERYTEG